MSLWTSFSKNISYFFRQNLSNFREKNIVPPGGRGWGGDTRLYAGNRYSSPASDIWSGRREKTSKEYPNTLFSFACFLFFSFARTIFPFPFACTVVKDEEDSDILPLLRRGEELELDCWRLIKRQHATRDRQHNDAAAAASLSLRTRTHRMRQRKIHDLKARPH